MTILKKTFDHKVLVLPNTVVPDDHYFVIQLDETVRHYIGDANGVPREVKGVAGIVAGAGYTHIQAVPSDTWLVTHGLTYRPGGIIVIDSSGRHVLGDISYDAIDVNKLTISYIGGFSGVAYIS